MPGLIGSQGVRPGAMNMNRIFRALRYRTEQAQYVTYHRPPIYGKDNYGVETGVVSGSELLMPDLPAIIRPTLTADYQIEKGGGNIIGAARVYTPNLKTIKNLPNFDQTNNAAFNEIEGWDRLISNQRTILNLPTSGTSRWSTDAGSVTSDGESLKNNNGQDGYFRYTSGSSGLNALEADRLRFKIKANFTANLTSFTVINTSAETLTYTPSSLVILPNEIWLTIDVPYEANTSSTSIYYSGSRKAVTVGGTYDYETNINKVQINFTKGDDGSGDTNDIWIKEVEFYKSLSWHVHSLKDMTDGYIIFNCVRTTGRRDSLRRAYD